MHLWALALTLPVLSQPALFADAEDGGSIFDAVPDLSVNMSNEAGVPTASGAGGASGHKPGQGIDPANYKGEHDADYFRKQFEKQNKKNAKKEERAA